VTLLLETRNLAAGYYGVPVTRDVSITVGAGEVVALLGPNGAGKTTTLLAISGLLDSIEGSIHLFGDATAEQRAHRRARRGLAHVPEDRSLFPDLTVRENLRVCWGATRDSIADAVGYFPPLEPLMQRKAGLLSGGEQQMLALARGFVGRPRLLIVDELSLGLAPVIVERILPAVRTLATRTGCGVLLVEQHVDLALKIADRAYVLVNGRVTVDGAAAELRSRRDLLTSSYLGDHAVDNGHRTPSGGQP
jgi:branched-chain amino acid transport system ATP-binding protein